jgi:GntR family transcriptional regulator
MIERMSDASAVRQPLHMRVYGELAGHIASGHVPANGKLPPERVISEQFGVSRATVRRALAALEADGLIEAVQGRGTFVRAPRIVEPANTLLSFTQLARERGTTPGAIVLRATTRGATIDEAERLRVAPGSDVFDVRRVRTIDSVPVAVSREVVPLGAAAEMVEADWTTASLYDLLTSSGNRPARADYGLQAAAATAEQAAHLDLEIGAPVLVADTSTYTREGRLVELGQIVYRGDRYRFRTTLVGPAAQLAFANGG